MTSIEIPALIRLEPLTLITQDPREPTTDPHHHYMCVLPLRSPEIL